MALTGNSRSCTFIFFVFFFYWHCWKCYIDRC